MILLNCWEGQDEECVFSDFHGSRWNSYRESDSIPLSEHPKFQGHEILFASYGQANYAGEAFVLTRKDGILYEVNGSHCSCYGLEGQWEPEEVTVENLYHRLEHGLGKDNYADNNFGTELYQFLDEIGN